MYLISNYIVYNIGHFKVPFYYRLREVGMPADYVNKLARMFQDIKVSEDLNQQFKEEYRTTKGSIAGKYNIWW